MKLTKSLFMLCAAGLSLCACDSDDIKDQLPEGNGAITVKVTLPETRATVGATTGAAGEDKVTVEGDIYVRLTATKGGGIQKVTAGNEVTFWGIAGPTMVEAFINGGSYVNTNKPEINTSSNTDADFTDGDDNYNMQAIATKVPAYGKVESAEINLTGESGYNNGISYQMYEATVTMQIPVARIEFAVNYDFSSTTFTALNFQGVYLDNILLTPDAAIKDYRHASDVDLKDGETLVYTTTATGSPAVLFDYPDSPLSFTTNKTGYLPETDQVYAYNIYPGDVPHIKLFFNGATSGEYVLPYQYAVVKSYKQGETPITEFEAGKIYRVTALNLAPNNLATKEDGTDVGIEYGIEVQVTEAKWDVVDVNGSWSQN